MDYNTSLSRFLTSIPERYEVAEGKITQVNAVEVEIDVNTGSAVSVKRVYLSSSKIEEEEDEN